MSFPRYPRYKASGVEWLGEVPEHWEVKRLRFAAELNPSKSEVANLDRETPVSFLPMESIGDDGTLALNQEKAIGELESGYTYFRDGDVTVAKITPCYENGKGALMCGLTNGIGFGTTELIVARPKPEHVTGPYLHYLFISPDFRGIGESHMYGAGGQKRVPDSFVRNFATAFPPTAEQTAIAEFLDRETGKIDELVAEQRRLMELLKEKRQAVISHAVTRGLNPAAPLKPSGIEWLGEVPKTWTVIKLGRAVFMQEGPGLRNWQFTAEGTRVICVTNITEAGIDFDRLEKFISTEEYNSSYRHFTVQRGDVLLSSSGNSWGKVAIYDGEEEVILNTSTIRLNQSKYAPLNRDYIALLLQSDTVREQLGLAMTGSCQPNFGPTHLNSVMVAIPLSDEQVAIVAALKRATAQLDTLTAEAQRAIDLLQERRTALISAAVTGQIDVRGSVASTSATG